MATSSNTSLNKSEINTDSLTSKTSNDNDKEAKTTMQSLNEVFGIHYYATRVVFDADGAELVYFNDNFWGKISMYLDGEEIFSTWTFLSFIHSDSSVVHEGKEYRVISSIKNWVTNSQNLVLIVDDSKAQSKFDPVFEGLDAGAITHTILGTVGLGLIVGLVTGFFF